MDRPAGSGPLMIQTGALFEDRYEVIRFIGAGSFASVYEVLHVGLKSRHALKVLDARLAEREDLRNRFLSEGRIQAQVRHPNIVAVTDTVTHPSPGLIMELVEGLTLEAYTEQQGLPLPADGVLAIMGPILEGVGMAHDAGVVHRDLKPQNILIGTAPGGKLRPQVADFGIAKVLDDAAVLTGKKRTETGVAMGTLLYMSPEQIRGESALDARSDIFSLGAILYEVVTGRIAFDSPSHFETMRRIVAGTFEPPERFVDGLHPVFAACIRMALAVDPGERFQTCNAFGSALEGVRDPGRPMPPTPSKSVAIYSPETTPAPARQTPSMEAATKVYTGPGSGPPPPPMARPGRPTTVTKSPGWAVALELCAGLIGFFGVGHAYNGKLGLGIALMVSYWILQGINVLLCFIMIGFLTLPLTLLLFAALSPWKAHNDAVEINRRRAASFAAGGEGR